MIIYIVYTNNIFLHEQLYAPKRYRFLGRVVQGLKRHMQILNKKGKEQLLVSINFLKQRQVQQYEYPVRGF